ncbi:MAG: Rne/Rng family ribonuclease, partial [Janthinobacterium lividum]
MLIDATHAEETRVVVLDGNRLEDFDVETAAKQQLKGNIYLAKVVRVEPSLQAAFVEYGGGRHGFLAFGEIHPDYYQIPVADRQRLMELQEAEARAEEEADDAAAAADEAAERRANRSHDAAPVATAVHDQDQHDTVLQDEGLAPSGPAEPSFESGALQDDAPRGLQSETAIPGHAEPENDLFPAEGSDTEFPLIVSASDVSEPDAAPLGIHNEAAIPGHAEPEHELAEAVDPAYGDQADISAVIEASLAGATPTVAEPTLTDIEPYAVPGIEGGVVDAGELPVVHHQQIADSETSAYEPDAGKSGTDEPGTDEPGIHGAQPTPDAFASHSGEEHAPTPVAIDDGVASDQAAMDEAGAEPRLRAQPATMAQDVIVASGAAYGDGADMALEAMEPAQSDSEFASSPASEPAGASRTQDEEHETREARAPARFMRSYKIQEVIRRRQILLIQVVKEERGSKGAALTTYISLAGRFSVLMPNSPRGGGISRKITSTADRRRLKEVTSELQIPRGMGLIVRTAGANRPKAEIKRDCEYLLELWDSIRETTMKSMAPALIHEEANLIKRAIRDNYSRDVDEVLVDGEAGWRAARDFMRMLMPAHARKVVLWNNPQPLFAHQAVEAQLDAMLVPTVQLKSGGYLVINQTEALVAVDVNSGRSTRERGIEETALKTNLEAADEVARQLRLRDLAGLIVIDFIDMESRRNNTAVEKRMKDALKDDRARIQLGSIS